MVIEHFFSSLNYRLENIFLINGDNEVLPNKNKLFFKYSTIAELRNFSKSTSAQVITKIMARYHFKIQ